MLFTNAAIVFMCYLLFWQAQREIAEVWAFTAHYNSYNLFMYLFVSLGSLVW